MRKTLALAGLVAGIAVTVLPVAPASAYCWSLGDINPCFNPCNSVANAYQNAENRTGGALPDHTFYCLD